MEEKNGNWFLIGDIHGDAVPIHMFYEKNREKQRITLNGCKGESSHSPGGFWRQLCAYGKSGLPAEKNSFGISVYLSCIKGKP